MMQGTIYKLGILQPTAPKSGHAPRILANIPFPCGEVAEWLKAAVSKAVVPFRGTVGSNPTLSAIFVLPFNRTLGEMPHVSPQR